MPATVSFAADTAGDSAGRIYPCARRCGRRASRRSTVPRDDEPTGGHPETVPDDELPDWLAPFEAEFQETS